MSPKLQAKNLTYDTSLPPFLQRLRALNTSASDGRHERPLARPKRARTADDDAEDEPTYVDEAGVGLGGEELRSLGLVKGAEAEGGAEEEKGGPEQGKAEQEEGEKEREKEKLAEIGAARRRKVGKVVGVDEEGAAPRDEAKAAPKKKGKAKKVKLSFGDDDE